MRWNDMPPLAALRAFAALAETRSLTQAGAALNVSHAAISQHMRALEDRLGVKLIRREGRGIVMTEEGVALAAALSHAFGEIAEAVDRLTGKAENRPVQVTTTPNFVTHWLAPRLGDFRRRHPKVELLINPSTELAEIGPDGYDVAIRSGRGPGWPGLDAELLVATPFVIVAAPDVIGSRKISRPEDLLDLPWVQELGTDDVTNWLAECGVTEARLGNSVTLPGGLIRDAVVRGEGVGALARAFLEDDIAAGRVRVLYEDARTMTGYYMVTAATVPRAPVKTFMTWLRRQAIRTGQAVADPVTIDAGQLLNESATPDTAKRPQASEPR